MSDTPPLTVPADRAAYAEAVQLVVGAAAAYYGDGSLGITPMAPGSKL
ncbi:hypothetical protein ACFQ08_44990 [Streptosporangium algeriense]|uniref:Uncharacterized protein n=1 Tax=Streptosporangium algeriense TaxID=1682748 RepID=A0ABW3E718_9ACTN